MPFAREYGGQLDNRCFGGAQVSRTFYCRGQTGQQLLLGAYSAMSRQIAAGTVTMHSRTEMLDLVVVDGHARGIVARDLVTGQIESYAADAVILATGGYGHVFYFPTNAKALNVHRHLARLAARRVVRQPMLHADPSNLHPVTGDYQSKLTLMSESLRNDGRIWVPKKKGETRKPNRGSGSERDYYLERLYPSFGNLVPRDVASRKAKEVCDEGRGVGPGGPACTSTSGTPSAGSVWMSFATSMATSLRYTTHITGDDPTTCRCESTRHRTIRWAAFGWTIT